MFGHRHYVIGTSEIFKQQEGSAMGMDEIGTGEKVNQKKVRPWACDGDRRDGR